MQARDQRAGGCARGGTRGCDDSDAGSTHCRGACQRSSHGEHAHAAHRVAATDDVCDDASCALCSRHVIRLRHGLAATDAALFVLHVRRRQPVLAQGSRFLSASPLPERDVPSLPARAARSLQRRLAILRPGVHKHARGAPLSRLRGSVGGSRTEEGGILLLPLARFFRARFAARTSAPQLSGGMGATRRHLRHVFLHLHAHLRKVPVPRKSDALAARDLLCTLSDSRHGRVRVSVSVCRGYAQLRVRHRACASSRVR
mmetsp:Transcript_42868/g.91516  ORF Transcript_42868/g.91516 Transcript_42868/m.91516 type:complete len:258 (+) Transcript_42868:385-1158(+)